MAGLLRNKKLLKLPSYGVISNTADLDNFKNLGEAYVYTGIVPSCNEGYIYCFDSSIKNGVVQLFFAYNGTAKRYRVLNWSTQKWTDWTDL